MIVTFVSECEKKALLRTRRVLDAFANRIGSRTWQTVITEEGLQAVKKLLRKSASKNTAVSCHWLHSNSRNRSELAWIVGNRSKFNDLGIVPVNRTQKNLLNNQWENDWHYLPLIKALAAVAALFHDWGKASACFQEKLSPKNAHRAISDPLRHEWISTLLLICFINGEQSDEAWLKRLADGDMSEAVFTDGLQSLKKNPKPLEKLPNTASLVAWLVLTHHRLPLDLKNIDDWKERPVNNLQLLLSRITAEWGYQNEAEIKRIAQCFQFPLRLPSQSNPLKMQLQRRAAELLTQLSSIETIMTQGTWRVILHHARLALMLGDHHYSSQEGDKHWKTTYQAIANTDLKTRQPKQKLDEHLMGVAKEASSLVRRLPLFESNLPPIYDVHTLKKKSADKRFAWQDEAVKAICDWKVKENIIEPRYGFFAVNMASTGCGKTLANAKIMQALSPDGESLRYALALGLRTLTLQTGQEYRDRIGLDNSELAVIIGSRAVMDLYSQAQNPLQNPQQADAEPDYGGSDSAEELWDDNDIDFDIPEMMQSALSTVWTDRKGTIDKRKQKFLYAPVLACTIDHLMAATETKRGGRYILPCLRLMSSDLVIDEVDDFDGNDLVAIARLVHLAGMLGRKVMISSATIPPALAEGYFNAYQTGWQLFAKTRDVSPTIGCAWFDEFSAQVETLKTAETPVFLKNYRAAHDSFVKKRCEKLLAATQLCNRRQAEIVTLAKLVKANEETLEQAFFSTIQRAIVTQHQRHSQRDPHSEKQVSFGVVRMANIPPCIKLTQFLANADWAENTDIRIMAYHSQQILLLRFYQELHLDAVLNRTHPKNTFENPLIRAHLTQSQAKNVIFILVATPVEEVGRDHDFDWAVIEPSSLRSIIQLAGRVLRHREQQPSEPNIALLQYNLKGFKEKDSDDLSPVFCRPGYENGDDFLDSHDLKDLIPAEQLQAIHAVPRILPNKNLRETERLADLEHHCLQQWLLNYKEKYPTKLQGWLEGFWCLTALPQRLTPFRKSEPEMTLFFAPDEQEENWAFREKNTYGEFVGVEKRYAITQTALSPLAQSRWWLWRDYEALLQKQADKKDLSLREAALRFGEIAIRDDGSDLVYCHQVGMWKQKG